MLSAEDIALVGDVASAAKLPGFDEAQFVQHVIDFLDGLRKKYEGGGLNPGRWIVKQALDTIITLLHHWIESQKPAPAG
jgi:hypothetical protein